MVRIGIDIGTSNTVVAVTTPGGTPEIRTIDNDTLLPSAVYVDENGGARTVGRSALDEWASPDFDQSGAFRRWKLQMGQGVVLRQMRFGGPASNATAITPELLTTWLVEHVVDSVSAGVGGEQVESVLVTVPHGWRRENPERCRATRLAAAAAVVAGEPVQVQETTLSEPVAAAVYWLWASRQDARHAPEAFVGRTVLVCDIGGGTFDLSLVRVGAEDEPLTVVDALNSEFAGDYVTALIMCRAAQAFNAAHGGSLPEAADDMLARVVLPDETWLRGWFLTAQDMQKALSVAMAAAARRNRPATASVQRSFRDAAGRSVELVLTPPEFVELLDPFYQQGRDLLRGFLARQGGEDAPYAVVFAGGGSRIAGVREHIVRPVLAETLPDGDEVLARIVINDRSIDQAIALGAALVANDVVRVQERLLYDVGMLFSVPQTLAEKLDLPRSTLLVVASPLLRRGAELPAKFRSSNHGTLPIAVHAGAETEIGVVVDDDPQDPWIQSWVIAQPADGREVTCDLEVTADADGILGVTLRPHGGRVSALEGRISRARTGRASLGLLDPGASARKSYPRVSLEQLEVAIRAARGVQP